MQRRIPLSRALTYHEAMLASTGITGTRALLVALGGAAGSVSRYVLSALVQAARPGTFPWGTLAVNALGCLLAGVVAGLADGRGVLGPEARILLLTGFLGGLTTFSAFGLETVQLFRGGQFAAAGLNVGLQLACGGAAVACGLWLTRA